MIPFPIYLTSIQDALEAGYNDFKREIAIYTGLTADSTLWTADQNAELARDVDEAYRWVLYPDSLPNERIPHTWSFLEQTFSLTTESGTYNYTLPPDFGSMVGTLMYYPPTTGRSPIRRTHDGEILRLRQGTGSSGYPTHFALRWLPQSAGSRQRQEMIFWPAPDGEYEATGKYAVYIGKLSESNPFPVGGPRMSQLLIEACKAIGETKRNGFRGDQWNMFLSRLQSAISLDKGTNTPRTVGTMCGGGGFRGLRDEHRVGGYYFGPDEIYGPTLYQLGS